ncbi:MAG TPA: 3-keto-5-aminohexanoate cleavage protein [Xanthobacteraceae bacterium]|nr:3-keto-5-aminohexanoate cleavage protein [Xanthobacteraceae bacterium]
MIVQACLNGAREASYHRALPVTADAIARDAVEVVAAGANEIHVHIRDADGRETLRPEFVDDAMTKLRRACPGTLIGVSTGEWIEKDDARRRDCIRNWSALPDYASVNLAEADCAAVIALLETRGIGIEAGIWTAADAARCLELDLGTRALRLLFEVMKQETGAVLPELAAIEARLGDAARRKPVLLHGFDTTAWVAVEAALVRGYSTRIGFEDTRELPNGVVAPSNAALVAAAVELRKALAARPGLSPAR